MVLPVVLVVLSRKSACIFHETPCNIRRPDVTIGQMRYPRLDTECAEIGRTWGQQEVDLWIDQHDDVAATMPEWTRGAYCGRLPGDIPMDGSDLAVALEDAIDDAAKEVWDAARA